MILLGACLAQAAQDFTPPSAVTLKSAMERRKARQAFLRGVKKKAATRSTDEWGEKNCRLTAVCIEAVVAGASLADHDYDQRVNCGLPSLLQSASQCP